MVGPPPRGGTQSGRWYGDVPPSRPPFSGLLLAPETRLFKPSSSPRDSTSIEKSCIFKTNFYWFWLNFSSWDTNFSKKYVPEKKSVSEILLLKTWAAHRYPHVCQLPPQGAHQLRFESPCRYMWLNRTTWEHITLNSMEEWCNGRLCKWIVWCLSLVTWAVIQCRGFVPSNALLAVFIWCK